MIYSSFVVTNNSHNPNNLKIFVQEIEEPVGPHLRVTSNIDLKDSYLWLDTKHFGTTPGRKSISGVLIKYYGSTIGWMSMAEYLWISRIINDIESKRPCFIIKTDNQSTMKIFKDGPQRHFKHIDIRREYVLDNLNRNECKIVYIPARIYLSTIHCTITIAELSKMIIEEARKLKEKEIGQRISFFNEIDSGFTVISTSASNVNDDQPPSLQQHQEQEQTFFEPPSKIQRTK
ncbi:hypothetical protein DERF_006299 [Dermatophagoides farinae]|uniref:Uncharacterized protein n=1 Tax=Dermatophagoides farinae TaxID=6954 RepID=A0A922I777_DERFA|nr:hypothetical protein DERF_006299 [Dermatophagoides farinae]